MSKKYGRKFRAGLKFQRKLDALSVAIEVVGKNERFCDVVDALGEMHNELVDQIIEVKKK